MKPSKAWRRSSGVRLRNVLRNAESLIPVKENSVVRSNVPSEESVPLEEIFIRLSSTGLTGDVRSVSPSGRATR